MNTGHGPLTLAFTSFSCPVCGSQTLVITVNPDWDKRYVAVDYDCPGGHLHTQST